MNSDDQSRYPLAAAVSTLCYVFAVIGFAASVVAAAVGFSTSAISSLTTLASGLVSAVLLVGLAVMIEMMRDAAVNSWRLRSAIQRLPARTEAAAGTVDPPTVAGVDAEIAAAMSEDELSGGTTSVACEFCGAILKVPIGAVAKVGKCPKCGRAVKLR